MSRREHWNRVYTTKQADEVSWFQTTPTRSLELLRQSGAGPERRIIDIGGGDSTLVDAVLAQQLGAITVLDISGAALSRARARLGARAMDVRWIEGDITRVALPPVSFDLWHDRAVFHFLTDADDRSRYVAAAAAALTPGGTLIMATFADDGPQKCSGLEVSRYSGAQLAATLGDAFEPVRHFKDIHRTPSGGEQRFLYAVFQRR